MPLTITTRATRRLYAPTVTLELSSEPIVAGGGAIVEVTATLDNASSEATTVTAPAAPVSPTVADYELSTNTTRTIAAGENDSSGTVTITAKNNDVDAPDKAVTVSGTATNPGAVEHDHRGGRRHDQRHRDPRHRVLRGHHHHGVGARGRGLSQHQHHVTIAAGQTDSTGTVTITAVANETDSPDRIVPVSGSATPLRG